MVETHAPRGRGRPRLAALTGAAAVLVGSLGLTTILGHEPPFLDVVLDRESAATTPDPEPAAPQPSTLPPGTTARPPTHDLAHLPEVPRQATLRGDGAGGCPWLEMDGEPHAAVWAPGTRIHVPDADPDAWLLVDGDGAVLAMVDAPVWFTGARSGAAERLERCHVGADHVWYVGDVGEVGEAGG